MGWKDVVLLERDQLTSGTTWHAAGLIVRFGSTSDTSTEMRKYTRHLYTTLEEETGQSTGFRPCGFIELATSPDRVEEFRRVAAHNRLNGVDVHEIGPEEIKRLFPLCEVSDVLCGFYVTDDGRVNPVDATAAFAKGAKMNGVKIFERTPVTDVLEENGEVRGVMTSRGKIEAEYVVNCTGMWARQFGERSGVVIPNQAAEHYYLLTDAIPEVDPNWPVIEDPSAYTYIRPEGAGLLVGLFETEAAAWNTKEIPHTFSFGEIQPDWDRTTPFLEAAMSRVPITKTVGAKHFFCGPESFTPDLRPAVGETPQIRKYFVAAGLNSIGILTGGGIGRLLAHWIINGKPDQDVTAINVDRFHKYQINRDYRAERVTESLGMTYVCHYPFRSPKTARGVKKTPLHDRLKEKGAYFKEVSGWESPFWFERDGKEPNFGELTWGHPKWFNNWKAEHEECRNGVALFDMSFMTKFLVEGRDAGELLNRLSTSNVLANDGLLNYTQWLNEDGKMEADVTVMKLQDEKYMVVATDTMYGHVHAWMKRHITPGSHVWIHDVTSTLAQINVQGPLSRDVMQRITNYDMSNENFPYRALREIELGYARVHCARISYVGELGYELYTPVEQAAYVYDRVISNGKHSVTHAGLHALASLRLEKAYRDYGHDMDNTDNLVELGLTFTCDMTKNGGFIGKEAIQRIKALGTPHRRMVQVLVCDSDPILHHAEIILRDNKPVGYVRIGSYGHTLGGGVGLAMVEGGEEAVTPAWLSSGKWEVDIANRKYPIRVSLRPLYDPNGERMKK